MHEGWPTVRVWVFEDDQVWQLIEHALTKLRGPPGKYLQVWILGAEQPLSKDACLKDVYTGKGMNFYILEERFRPIWGPKGISHTELATL